MPDISMCANTNCLMKELCYRYRAIPSEYQSIAYFTPEENGLCKYFWRITTERVKPVKETEQWMEGYKEQNDV